MGLCSVCATDTQSQRNGVPGAPDTARVLWSRWPLQHCVQRCVTESSTLPHNSRHPRKRAKRCWQPHKNTGISAKWLKIPLCNFS